MSSFSDFGPAIAFHHQPRPANMSEYPAFIRPGHSQTHSFNMTSFPGMQSPNLTPESHVMPAFNAHLFTSAPFPSSPMNTQAYIHAATAMQSMGQNFIDPRVLYNHQMAQYLRDQQVMIQHQLEQQAFTQLHMEHEHKDQAKIAAVGRRLGDQVTASENIPFGIPATRQKFSPHGVVRISNLPYAVTRHEIHQLLGRHACVLGPEHGGGVHIIMERSTAKTMNAFVEFKTQKDAEAAVRRLSFTESGRYARLGTRHVDISMSSQDELLKNIFPRANCIQWQNESPVLIENNDPYSVGFQGFLTKEEIRGLVSHAENPARSPFTERCRQRTYECLISTLWKYPWSASTMYTVEDRDSLFQATLRQLLELSEKAKQRRFIGLDEALLRDLLRAGLSCSAFNERQKICLIAASELPPLQPIVHHEPLEFWPFDCLVKQPKADDYEVMYYAQLIRKGLEVNAGKDLAVPNNWRNRYDEDNERPWGNLWIEWQLHNKTMIFEAAAQLEMKVAMCLLQAALGGACNTLQSPLPSMCQGASLEPSSNALGTSPSQTTSKKPFRDCANSLPSLWAEENAKRTAMNAGTPSHRPHRNSSISTVSDDGSFGSAINGVHRSTSNSTTFSAPFSLNSSTCSSLMTNDSDGKLDKAFLSECSEVSRPKITGSRHHKHSLSMSSIATGTIPSSIKDNGTNISSRSRRGESISIPTHMTGFKDDLSTTPSESLDITDLMARHNIWSGTLPSLTVKTPPSPASQSGRSRYGSRHTSGSSQSGQHRRLASVSEDEEDAFKKRVLDSALTSA